MVYQSALTLSRYRQFITKSCGPDPKHRTAHQLRHLMDASLGHCSTKLLCENRPSCGHVQEAFTRNQDQAIKNFMHTWQLLKELLERLAVTYHRGSSGRHHQRLPPPFPQPFCLPCWGCLQDLPRLPPPFGGRNTTFGKGGGGGARAGKGSHASPRRFFASYTRS